MRRLARLAAVVGLALVATACPNEPTTTAATSSASSSAPSATAPPVARAGNVTAAAAMRALCVPPVPFTENPPPAGEAPPAVAEIEDEVRQVRGLDWVRPVAVQAIDDAEMDRKLAQAFGQSYPATFYARRTQAWRTIGVIPPDADLREALERFSTGQVIGFYNPEDGELVYLGQGELDLTERFTLAHELTHAIDDQNFDLTRLDAIANRCRDEESEAALGAVEGSAQYFAAQVLVRFPTLDLGDLADLIGQLGESDTSVQGVPPFVQELSLWPYTAGLAFMTALDARGGLDEVNAALRDFPVSTEQVIHPDRYPNDTPEAVDVPDIAPALGGDWGDLDVMQVGEEWLRAMLRLRLDETEADDAAAGWGGGLYRAWSDGNDAVVALRTAWDTEPDAAAFMAAMQAWADDRAEVVVGEPSGQTVDVVFATSGSLATASAAALPAA
jgi:3',5'-cyclic AMP phosphodiesterase CpdA